MKLAVKNLHLKLDRGAFSVSLCVFASLRENDVGIMALKQPSYTPDFDAVATSSCRILQISRDDYNSALKRKSVRNGVRGWPESLLL